MTMAAQPKQKPPERPRTILECLDDPALFKGKGLMDGASWDPWKAFLAALFALPMTDGQLELYRRHTGRHEPPTKVFRAGTLIVGRRGGKSACLAVVATYLAVMFDHRPYLRPGEVPVIAVLAKDRAQAKVILGYILGGLRAVPALAELVGEVKAESVHLKNGVSVEIFTASTGAPRGRTFLAVLMDELAFWPTGDNANPDDEVMTAVRPGLRTIPHSLLLIASSPYAKRGLLYSDYAQFYGKDDALTLVWKASTVEMNSDMADEPDMMRMYREDPDRADAEHGGNFRTDIVSFITREAVEAVVADSVLEIPHGGGVNYVGFVDPSGGSADSFTLSIAHAERDGLAVLDVVREIRPPFSPDGVVQEYAATLKVYGISRVIGDAYAGHWPRERFAVHGIQYDVSKINKSMIYSEFLPALNGRRVQLLDNERLIGQLCALERRVARGGRDSIDHSPGAHDDLANAACGALVHVIAERVPALLKPKDLLENGAPVEMPKQAPLVYAVMCVGDDGMAAVLFATYQPLETIRVKVVDFTVEGLSTDLVKRSADRLVALGEQVGARRFGFYVPAPLVKQFQLMGIGVEEHPEDFADAEAMALSAALHIRSGHMKITAEVEDKAANYAFSGAFDFRAGEPVTDDPLRHAALLATVIGTEGDAWR
jgi:hypothetical protein